MSLNQTKSYMAPAALSSVSIMKRNRPNFWIRGLLNLFRQILFTLCTSQLDAEERSLFHFKKRHPESAFRGVLEAIRHPTGAKHVEASGRNWRLEIGFIPEPVYTEHRNNGAESSKHISFFFSGENLWFYTPNKNLQMFFKYKDVFRLENEV